MDIERIDSYSDPRFPWEVLSQHGAFLVDGKPWAFRVVSDRAAVITAERITEEALQEAVENFRFYAGHITEFYDKGGRCLMRLPPVERREAPIDGLQPSQFSVDEDKRAAVDGFLHTAADLVIPVTELADGTLCTMDGHTRLYAAWRKGIRRAMVFRAADQDMAAGIADFAAEARKRGIFHIRDMALLSHEEQEEKWDGWCDAYFARQAEGK